MARLLGRLVVSGGLALALLCAAAIGIAWAAPPPNDTRENATLIPALPFTDTVETTEATGGPEDAAACPLPTPMSKSVWYRYTAPSDQVVVIDTTGSSYVVGGIVSTADSCVTLFGARGVFSAQAGQTYWIALGDVGGSAGGSLQLSVDINPEYVVPETVVSGRARLSGPSGCVYRAFRARVVGRRIASVRFFVDGRLVKRIDERQQTYTVRVRPKGLGLGFHRVSARVRFVRASETAPRTLRLTFRRCARQTVSPRFTG